MRRLGRVAAVRWGFGGYSPLFLFTTGFFVLMLYPAFAGSSTIDIQVHDTYFVIANAHATRGVGILFGFAAAVYFYYPRVIRRPLQPALGYLHFWLTTVGFLLFFGTMDNFIGSSRYIEVREGPYWGKWSTITLLVLGAGLLVFLINLVYSALKPVERGSEIR